MQSVNIQIEMKSRRTRVQINFNLFFFYLSEPVKNSFGATTVSNLMPNSSVFWLHAVFAIIYTVIMVIALWCFTNKCSSESHDDSKKTIMITNVPKNVTVDLIRKHFRLGVLRCYECLTLKLPRSGRSDC